MASSRSIEAVMDMGEVLRKMEGMQKTIDDLRAELAQARLNPPTPAPIVRNPKNVGRHQDGPFNDEQRDSTFPRPAGQPRTVGQDSLLPKPSGPSIMEDASMKAKMDRMERGLAEVLLRQEEIFKASLIPKNAQNCEVTRGFDTSFQSQVSPQMARNHFPCEPFIPFRGNKKAFPQNMGEEDMLAMVRLGLTLGNFDQGNRGNDIDGFSNGGGGFVGIPSSYATKCDDTWFQVPLELPSQRGPSQKGPKLQRVVSMGASSSQLGKQRNGGRKFASLGMSLSTAMERLVERGFLRPLDLISPPKVLPSRRSAQYCTYHQCHGHITNHCFRLRCDIQDLIDDGKVVFPIPACQVSVSTSHDDLEMQDDEIILFGGKSSNEEI